MTGTVAPTPFAYILSKGRGEGNGEKRKVKKEKSKREVSVADYQHTQIADFALSLHPVITLAENTVLRYS